MSDVMDELIDILAEDGTPTGQAATKYEIYQHGYWHRSVHVWIINEHQELLVQKRNPHKKTYPNLWAISSAGHVLTGETSAQAAVRELKEELDIDVSEGELEFLFTVKREQEAGESHLRVIDDVYLLHRNLDVDQTKVQVEELTDVKYVYYEYLESIFKNGDPSYVPYCEEHKKLFRLLEDRYHPIEII